MKTTKLSPCPDHHRRRSCRARLWRRSGEPAGASRRRTVVLNLYSQHKRQSPFFQTRSRVVLDRYFTRELADLIWQDARASLRAVKLAISVGIRFITHRTCGLETSSVRERSPGSYGVEVVASFLNFNERHEVVFRLVPAGSSWKVADIVYDNGTTLMGILKGSESPVRRGKPRSRFIS